MNTLHCVYVSFDIGAQSKCNCPIALVGEWTGAMVHLVACNCQSSGRLACMGKWAYHQIFQPEPYHRCWGTQLP